MEENSTIRRLIAGDIRAFEQVFREYSRSLYLIAMGIVNDEDVARDAVQESFVYLWSHRDQIDDRHPIENYLRKSVKNYILNHFRHLKVRTEHAGKIVQEQELLGEDEEDMTSKLEQIRRLVDSLPESCRKIFVMAVIEGMSYTDTAQAMEVSVNTVKSQIKIAYKKIKENIRKNPNDMALMPLFLSILLVMGITQ